MASNTIKVQTPSAHGSGAFIAKDLVVTAAHVIQPEGQAAPWPADQLQVILYDGTSVRVVARRCHPRWAGDFEITADMAVLRVDTAQPHLVVAAQANPTANHRKVSITGYREGPNPGTVTRANGLAGQALLDSDDLAFHDGVSGAPIVASNGAAIGIATRSADTPIPRAAIGIPFLHNAEESNLQALIASCPKQGPT